MRCRAPNSWSGSWLRCAHPQLDRWASPPAGLWGAGGFGKTTLAQLVAHHQDVRASFPDGVVWVTVGEDANGPALAEKVGELTAALSGTRPAVTEPRAAGDQLGNVLGGRRILDETYLWSWLATHLHGAGLTDELAETQHDPRWLVAKLRVAGPAALEADLSLSLDVSSRAVATVVRSVVLWHSGSGRTPQVLEGHEGDVTAISVAPDGSWLASADSSSGGHRRHSIRVWNVVTGHAVHVIALGEGGTKSLAVAPDGSWFAGGGTTDRDGRAGAMWICDPATGDARQIRTGAGAVNALAVAPDGRWLASADGNVVGDHQPGSVRLWDPATGRLRHTLTGHTGRIIALAVDPAGAWIASASTDCTVRIWDPLTGIAIHTLTDHGGRVNALAVAPDGSWLASAAASAETAAYGSGIPSPADSCGRSPITAGLCGPSL